MAAGTLTLIAAGDRAVLEELRPVVEVLGQLHVVGDRPGMGQAVKHCNQLLVTVVHAATVEAITLARKSGLDVTQVCEIIGSGIAGNDYFRLVSKAIIENTDSPGGMGQLWKDVNIVVNSARTFNLPLLAATAASQYFQYGHVNGNGKPGLGQVERGHAKNDGKGSRIIHAHPLFRAVIPKTRLERGEASDRETPCLLQIRYTTI